MNPNYVIFNYKLKGEESAVSRFYPITDLKKFLSDYSILSTLVDIGDVTDVQVNMAELDEVPLQKVHDFVNKKNKVSLKDLVKEFFGETHKELDWQNPSEIDWGKPVGKEIW